MLEMEADLPLSNNQLQAELKKELKGEGGVEGGGDGDATRHTLVGTKQEEFFDVATGSAKKGAANVSTCC